MSQAQFDSKTSFGVGLGSFQYFTHWYYYRFDAQPQRYNYPQHKLNRAMLIFTGEKSNLWRGGNFKFDGVGEVGIAFAGKTKGTWLPNDEVISKGGLGIQLGGYVRAGYPVTADRSIVPFVSLGPQVAAMYNNGKGLGEFSSRQYYSYGDGWTEFMIMLAGSVGCTFDVSGFTLVPEFRFGVTGFSFTNWEPNEEGVQMDGSPGMIGFSVKVCKTL